MPVCVHCSHWLPRLYHVYGSSHVACVRCPACTATTPSRPRGTSTVVDSSSAARFADPYIEQPLTTVVLDLILVKASAYRHLLFNGRRGLGEHEDDDYAAAERRQEAGQDASRNAERGQRSQGERWNAQGDHGRIPIAGAHAAHEPRQPRPSPARRHWWIVLKRGTALVMVDAYLQWFHLCKPEASPMRSEVGVGFAPSLQPTPSLLPGLKLPLPRAIPKIGRETTTMQRAIEDVVAPQGVSVLLQGYGRVLGANVLETLAMHLVVVSLATLYVYARPRGRRDSLTRGKLSGEKEQLKSGADRSVARDETLALFRPHLVSSALLLSQVTPLFLLVVLLLWQSRLPNGGGGQGEFPRTTAATAAEPCHAAWPEAPAQPWEALRNAMAHDGARGAWRALGGWTAELAAFTSAATSALEARLSGGGDEWRAGVDWAIRGIIGGLSAGMALAVVLPRSSLLTTAMLLLGWGAQGGVRRLVGMPAAGGIIGIGGGDGEEELTRWWCAA